MSKIIPKVSRGSKVYEKIKKAILDNDLKPGERLTEEDLAAKLDVSRTPVREALRQLDQDGLVTHYPGRGSIVSQISEKTAKELYEVREALEGLATRLICENINEEDLNNLKNIVLQMDESIIRRDYATMSQLHRAWNDSILELTTNEFLKNYLTSTMENLGRLRVISLYRPEHSMSAYEETKDILRAIVDNDPEKSESLTKKHVQNARKRFEKNLSHNQKEI